MNHQYLRTFNQNGVQIQFHVSHADIYEYRAACVKYSAGDSYHAKKYVAEIARIDRALCPPPNKEPQHEHEHEHEHTHSSRSP